MSKIKLGQQVVVSDPCYTIPTWCQAVVDGVKPGTYESYVKKVDLNDWGVRCSMLIAVHEDYRDGVLRWEEYPADIGIRYRDWETDRKSTRLNSSHRP